MRLGDGRRLRREVEGTRHVQLSLLVGRTVYKEMEGDKKVGGTVTDPNTPPIRNLHFKCALLAKCKCDRCDDLTVKLKHNTHYFNAAVVIAQQSNAAFRRLGQTCNRNSGRD